MEAGGLLVSEKQGVNWLRSDPCSGVWGLPRGERDACPQDRREVEGVAVSQVGGKGCGDHCLPEQGVSAPPRQAWYVVFEYMCVSSRYERVYMQGGVCVNLHVCVYEKCVCVFTGQTWSPNVGLPPPIPHAQTMAHVYTRSHGYSYVKLQEIQ